MRLKFLKKIKPRSFNKRFSNKYKFLSIKKFNINLIVKKQILFELIYFKIIKLFFKKSYKYKYQVFKHFYIFFNLFPNYPVSIKSKKSRMGKGIGKFLRWVFILPSNSIVLAFNSLYYKRFLFLLNLLKKRISQNLFFKVICDNY